MNHQPNPVLFFVSFVGLWLTVTTVLGFLSGWYRLASQYPDRPEEPLLTLKGQSGMLGIVGMRGILNLSACPSGLRVRLMRLFGPFSPALFVPWGEISVDRKDRWFQRTAVLTFQTGGGRLSIPENAANRLASAVPAAWPEPGPFPQPSDRDLRSRLFKGWLAATAVASVFFLLVPRLVAPTGARPPAAVAILFPAIGFAIGGLVQYLRRRS